MKEFSDEFLKDLLNQRADEFDPQDNLQLEWDNISRKLPRRRYTIPYFSIAVITGVIILFMVTDKGFISEGEVSSLKMPSLALDSAQTTNKKEINHEKDIHEKAIKEIVKIKIKPAQQNHYSSSSFDRKNSKGNIPTTLSRIENSPLINKTDGFKVESPEEEVVQIKSVTAVATKKDTTQAVQIPLLNSDSSKTNEWALYASLFCNNNWLRQVNDQMYLQSIETENRFNNRMGIRITLTTPSFKSKLGQVHASFSYGFIKKEYYLRYELFTPEWEIEYGGYSVNTLNHFLSVGLNTQIRPRISTGIQYEFVYNSRLGTNLARSRTGDDFFSNHYILLNLTSDIYLRKNLRVSAYFEYGLPIAQKYFQVHQMNIGLRGRVFKW